MVTARLAPVLFAVSLCTLALVVAGCDDDDVGIPCVSTAPTGGTADGGGGTQINSQALDCRSRLCIYYAGSSKSRALCTKICSSDKDCPKNTESCPSGYRCIVGQLVGSLKCCKMCVCDEFIAEDPGFPSACANYTPNCPEL